MLSEYGPSQLTAARWLFSVAATSSKMYMYRATEVPCIAGQMMKLCALKHSFPNAYAEIKNNVEIQCTSIVLNGQ
jgi:hypothetical protein